MKRTALLLSLLVIFTVAGRAAEAEIKFVVQQGGNTAALEKLASLKEAEAKNESVCFFDTAQPSLGQKPSNLILRARQKKGEAGDSTVKVRSDSGAAPSGPVESGITAEEDWTNLSAPNISRSLDQKTLPDGVFAKVMAGSGGPQSLFGAEQLKLINERLPSLDWSVVRRYGPLEAQVWKKKHRLSDAFPEVTVEKWRLEKPGAKREVVELSIKVKDLTTEGAKVKTAQFFQAAQDAGFGAPEATSKTRIALDFYQPGK